MATIKDLLTKKEKPQQEQMTKQQRIFREIRDYLYIFAGFMFAFALLFRVVMVDGPSMNQTLVDGDRLLLVSRTLYRNPKPGDIVVASKESFRDGENIIKRVIATEGQTVDIDFEMRTVYVDGIPLQESYAYFQPGDSNPMLQEGMQFPLTVAEGKVFVMGDNRNNSMDSRSVQIGLIDRREILGKAVFLIFPGNDGGRVAADFRRIGVLNR